MTGSDVNVELREFLEQIKLPTRPRRTFDSPLPVHQAPQQVRLSQGPSRTTIIGIPSTVALCGPHQYLEFSKTFRDVCNLCALAVPGFVGQEPLPATVEVAVTVQAEAVRRCTGDGLTVLAGYSSGGTFAYGIASHLEATGTPVQAVVLLDAYPFHTVGSQEGRTQALLRRMFEEPELRMYLTATRLSAMDWYTRLFTDWELPQITAPTLLVQPSDPMPGMASDGDWRAVWPTEHETVEVPGDHWTMMMGSAPATAVAVGQWLRQKALLERGW